MFQSLPQKAFNIFVLAADNPARLPVPMSPAANAPAPQWFPLRAFGFALAGLLAIWFWPILVGGESFIYRDFGYFGYPLAAYHHDSFWRGEIPLWNPCSHCGLPFLAQWNTMVLYPGSFIYLLGPPGFTLSLFSLAHLWLAGVGMFVLARKWYASDHAAAFAGFGFVISGLGLNFLLWPNNVAALAWMPFIILFGTDAIDRTSFLRAVLTGSMQMLTGAPEIILLTWATLFALMMVRGWEEKRWQWPVRSALLAGLVAAVCAAQLLPFLELTSISQRHREFGGATWSMPLWGWASFLVPQFFTYILSSGVRFQYEQLWTSSYYLAIPVTLCAVLGILRWKERSAREKALALLTGFSILLAFGPAGHIYTICKSIIPGLGLIRFPIKFIVLAIFALPLLAAAALAQSAPALQSAKTRAGALAFLSMLILGVLAYAKFFPKYEPPFDNWPLTLRSGITTLLFAASALFLFKSQRRWAPLALVALIPFEIALQVGNPAPSIARGALQALPEKHDAGVASRAMMTREAWETLYQTTASDTYTNFLLNRAAWNANLNLIDRQPKVDGFFSLNMAETERLRTQLYAKGQENLTPLLDFMNVTSITDSNNIFRWATRANSMPLVTAGQVPRTLDTTNFPAVLFNIRFNPRTMVLLTAATSGYETNAVPASVTALDAGAHRIAFDVDAPKATFAVIAESFHPNWTVRVNGQPQEKLRANYAFMAVPLLPGHSKVELVYDDRAFKYGLAFSLATLAALFAFALKS